MLPTGMARAGDSLSHVLYSHRPDGIGSLAAIMGLTRFIIGIDLGTTNSAVAYVDLTDPADPPPIRLFKVPQLQSPFDVQSSQGLPSFLYLPGEHDLPKGASGLPWAPDRNYIVGTFAREQGALVPARLVSSAKSWLCHGGVDREGPILPWGSPADVPHLSPVEVSARYLAHMREAWDHAMSEGRPEWCMGQCDVMLTVPASFDEVARELTVRAAHQAGLRRLTLLEEPQAAFYSWVRSQGEFWQEQLSEGNQILVCDVGGGTTDFSLIAVKGTGQDLSLERVAVGDHLMLGGDNMDLALARHLEARLVKRAGELDPRQWGSLVHACRKAKETLLGDGEEDRFTVHLAGRGSRVVGGALRIDLFRDEVEKLVLDGFFPLVTFDEPPHRSRGGLQELGLPYAQDPAVTRNLSAFLRRHQAKPDAVLFNGGAMKATQVQDRVVETMSTWFGQEPTVLESSSLDLAVALGAATYGLVRAGKGVRIRGATARAYYVGVDTSRPEDQRAVCLIPFGIEEGGEITIPSPTFEAITDRPVTFPLYSSSAPLGHDAGQIVDVDDDLYVSLPPLYTVLHFDRGLSGETVPVSLGARLTELGTLQLFCMALRGGHRWDLEFSLRTQETSEERPSGAPVGDRSLDLDDDRQLGAARLIRSAFRPHAPGPDGGPRTLVRQLEELLGADRLAWPGPFIRGLWGPMWETSGHRTLGADHEAAWLNLAGILLRPGFGDPLDAGRIENLWTIFRAGLEHEDDLWCRVAWWVLWRRVSGGLNRGQQLELSNRLCPPLLSGEAVKAAQKSSKKSKKGKKGGSDQPMSGLNRQELVEMWRTAASLERIPRTTREGLGDVALRNAVAGRGDFAFWALGRFGARVPLYGPTEETAARPKVEAWLERLLSLDWERQRGLALSVAQMARLCGDPARDIDEGLRVRLIERLRAIACPESVLSLLTEIQVLQELERGQMFGDALPTGLRLSP